MPVIPHLGSSGRGPRIGGESRLHSETSSEMNKTQKLEFYGTHFRVGVVNPYDLNVKCVPIICV